MIKRVAFFIACVCVGLALGTVLLGCVGTPEGCANACAKRGRAMKYFDFVHARCECEVSR